jgi:hypothetical protein
VSTCYEVDGRGLVDRIDTFRPERLGDAIVLLYERYAESLPAGPRRERASATARSVAMLRENPDRWPFARASS